MWEAEKRVQKILYRLDCPSFGAAGIPVSDGEIFRIFKEMGIHPEDYIYSHLDEGSNTSFFTITK